jgi:hypothetical protein
MRNAARQGQGRARVLARREYAGNCRPHNPLDGKLTLGFEMDREDTIPPFARRTHTIIA